VYKRKRRTYAQISKTVAKNVLVLADVDGLELERQCAAGDETALALRYELKRLVDLHAAIGFSSQFSR
jgi:hypothetical protein